MTLSSHPVPGDARRHDLAWRLGTAAGVLVAALTVGGAVTLGHIWPLDAWPEAFMTHVEDRSQTPSEQTNELHITGTIRITDDELFQVDEVRTYPVDVRASLTPSSPTARILEWDQCVGGEVRVAVIVTASLESADRAVLFEGHARLWEGSDCRTSDLDASTELSVSVGAGIADEGRSWRLVNSGFSGGDEAVIRLSFTNTVAEPS